MRVHVSPKHTEDLLPTGILHQTAFWSRVKARTGWDPEAYDLLVHGGQDAPADMLVVRRRVGSGASIAYVPFGPEYLPLDGAEGQFLERLSEHLRPLLPRDCIFLRYELPWNSPYAAEPGRYDADGNWLGAPDPALRELRMNSGTSRRLLRKAPTDVMPPDTILVDLRPAEDALAARMRPKTRYNIGLAARKGVQVTEEGTEGLGAWYDLYAETARRNRFVLHDARHFEAVVAESRPGSARVHLLVARRDGRPLAGMLLAIAGPRATYLAGASSDTGREAMAGYALQWSAIRVARARGATEYDMFGCAPGPDPAHPLHGLWRFKTGFGGDLVHRQGCWDYPFDSAAYAQWRNREALSAGFHL